MTRLPIDRRTFLAGAAAAAALPFSAVLPARAANPRGVPLHGLSAFGELKYGPDFEAFDYANPDAPKGGRFAFAVPNWLYNQNPQTFNTLSTFTLRNDAPPRMEITYDTLMTEALDEPDSIYGLLAESVTISEDGNAYTFVLRPEARFANDTPVLARDVAYTMLTLAELGHPQLRLPLASLVAAEVVDERTVRLVFDGEQSPRNILTVASSIPIVSADTFAYREFEGRHSEPIVGSGPYEVSEFDFGRFIEYRRRPDYWAADLPVQRGMDHFDTIRVEFYTERQVALEAFKKGDLNYREEFTSLTWATAYDFPAVRDGRVVKEVLPGELRPSLRTMALNMRRAPFDDERVRRAVNLAFDFEWINGNIFYDAYTRSQSPFMNSDLMATGAPDDAELTLLEPFRELVPASVFEDAELMPVSDGSGSDRAMLREATRLLREAGFERDGTALMRDGKALTLEILVNAPVFERVLNPYIENLRRIGIEASLRLVDPAQYANRLDEFDFDMILGAISLTATPTEDSLRSLFHSSTVNDPGASNWAGIDDPAVDALIRIAGEAIGRDELRTAVRALDRVLRANFYLIPSWDSNTHRLAWWDVFGRGAKPDYAFPVERLWWWDEGKAAAIGMDR